MYQYYGSSAYLLSYHFFFFFNDTATTEIYTLPLHDALPILGPPERQPPLPEFEVLLVPPENRYIQKRTQDCNWAQRSEEHTSELQSPCNLVCRLLLEKKKNLATTLTVEAVCPM